jgi:hypothetical protein
MRRLTPFFIRQRAGVGEDLIGEFNLFKDEGESGGERRMARRARRIEEEVQKSQERACRFWTRAQTSHRFTYTVKR